MNVRSHDPSPRSRHLHGSRTILTIVSNAQCREFRRPTKCSSPSSFFETRHYNAEEWLPGRKLPAPVNGFIASNLALTSTIGAKSNATYCESEDSLDVFPFFVP